MAENLIPLGELLPLDEIPEGLGSVRDGLSTVVSKLFVADLQSKVSNFIENSSHSLTLVSCKRLA
jgi:hypothetical protein